MNIAVWTAHFLPHLGGVENFSARLWPCIAAKGHVVQLLTCNTEGVCPVEVYKGVQVRRVRCISLLSKRFPIPSLRDLNRLLKTVDFDVAVTNTRFFPMSAVGAFVARKRRRSYVHIEHGSGWKVTENPLVNLVVGLVDASLGTFVVRKAAKVVGVSSSSAQYCCTLGAANAEVIPNAIDTSRFSSANPLIRAHLGLTQDKCTVLFAGRLVREKGIELFIRLAKELSRPDVCFLVAGDGPLASMVTAAVQSTPNLVYLGRVDLADMPKVYASTDILCHPSWYLEGCPTVLLEAGAAGCALVAADTTGVRDIIPSERFGVITKPRHYESLRDSVTTLLLDRARRRAMGRAIQERIQSEFDLYKVADRIEKILNCFSNDNRMR